MKKNVPVYTDPEIRKQFGEWHRALDVLTESNVLLQQRLSAEVQHAGGNRELLELLEKFLDSLLIKDIHISLLRKDIRAQEAFMQHDGHGTDFLVKQQRLQEDVTRMSREFGKLKADFEAQFRMRS